MEELLSCLIKPFKNSAEIMWPLHLMFINFHNWKVFFLLPCEMSEPWWICFFMYLFTDQCMQSWKQHFCFIIDYSLWAQKKLWFWVRVWFGLGSKFNCSISVGSGSAFSLKPVQTSTLYPTVLKKIPLMNQVRGQFTKKRTMPVLFVYTYYLDCFLVKHPLH